MKLEFGEGVNVGKLELVEDGTFGLVTWKLDVKGRILVGSHPLTGGGHPVAPRDFPNQHPL